MSWIKSLRPVAPAEPARPSMLATVRALAPPAKAGDGVPMNVRLGGGGTVAAEEDLLILPEDRTFGGGPPVQWSADIHRVAALPRRTVNLVTFPPEAAALLAKIRKPAGPCKCKELGAVACILTPFPIQQWAVFEASKIGGGFFPIGVGHGKTWITMVLPMLIPEVKRVILFIPPNMREQFAHDWRIVGQHWRLPNLAGDAGGRFVADGRPVVRVIPYSKLSHESSTNLMEQFAPQLIIADEAHKLSNQSAAGTSRVLRFLHAHPETRAVFLSGSFTDKSITDYAHLAELSLKEGSPLPLDYPAVQDWAGALDPRPNGPRKHMGALRKIFREGEDAREGFKNRLRETLGVVATEEGAISTSLVFEERKLEILPRKIIEMLEKLRGPEGLAMRGRRGDKARETHEQHGDWKRPDGEELVSDLEVARVAREVAAGFYYRWRWPRGEPEKLITLWLVRRAEWHRELRDKLHRRPVHMDSPLLCWKAADRWHNGFIWVDEAGTRHEVAPECRRPPEHLPTWAADTWPAWMEVAKQCRPEKEAYWVDDYLAQDTSKWARDSKAPGIVWFAHDAFGRKVAELSGLTLYSGGKKASLGLVAENGKKSIIASIKAHGTGKNLQRFYRQIVSNPPVSGRAWEQLLGRTHRTGQPVDPVEVHLYRHTEEIRDSFERARGFAAYVQETMGTRQKLLYASYNFALGEVSQSAFDLEEDDSAEVDNLETAI